MSRKTVYYHDPLHDDFAPTNGHIHPKPIGADFPYEHKGPLWNALAFVVYRMVMTPFLFLYCKLVSACGSKTARRCARCRAGTSSTATTRTHWRTPSSRRCCRFRGARTSSPPADTVSIPGLRNIVQMLGAIPLADTIDGTRQFLAAMHRRLNAVSP